MALARRCCSIFFYPINKAVRHPRDGPLKACNLERRLVHHCAGADKHAISAGIDCQSPFCHFNRVPDCTAVLLRTDKEVEHIVHPQHASVLHRWEASRLLKVPKLRLRTNLLESVNSNLLPDRSLTVLV